MALDLTDAFTIGDLDRGRMDGTVLVGMRGKLTSLVEATFSISRDGVVTATGIGDPTALRMDFGAGQIKLTNLDPDGTGTGLEGSVVTIDFTFGDSLETDKNKGVIELIAVVANCGWSIDFREDDPAPAPVGLIGLDGNTATFAIGAPYEAEGGTQEDIGPPSDLCFDILAIAKGRIVGV